MSDIFSDWLFERDANGFLWVRTKDNVNESPVSAILITSTPFHINAWYPKKKDSTCWCIGVTWKDPDNVEHKSEFLINDLLVDSDKNSVYRKLAYGGFIIHSCYMFEQYVLSYITGKHSFGAEKNV